MINSNLHTCLTITLSDYCKKLSSSIINYFPHVPYGPQLRSLPQWSESQSTHDVNDWCRTTLIMSALARPRCQVVLVVKTFSLSKHLFSSYARRALMSRAPYNLHANYATFSRFYARVLRGNLLGGL